jgi:hypothetical protein
MDVTQKKLKLKIPLYIASAILLLGSSLAAVWYIYSGTMTNAAKLHHLEINLAEITTTHKQLKHYQLEHAQQLAAITKQLAIKTNSPLLQLKLALHLLNLANYHLLMHNYSYVLSILKKALIAITDKDIQQYISAAINQLVSDRSTDSSIILAQITHYLDILTHKAQPQSKQSQQTQVIAHSYLAKIQQLFASLVTVKRGASKTIDGGYEQLSIQLYLLQRAILTHKPALYASSIKHLSTLLAAQAEDPSLTGLLTLINTLASQPLTTIEVDLTTAIEYLKQNINLLSTKELSKPAIERNIIPQDNIQLQSQPSVLNPPAATLTPKSSK